jgi:hypothetical protein
MLSIIIGRIQDSREDDLVDNGNSADLMDSLSDFLSKLLPESTPLYAFRSHDDQDNLNAVADILKNVKLDSDFLGLTWDEVKDLSGGKIIMIDQSKIEKSGIKISFTKDPTVLTPYIIQYLPGRVSLKINTNDPSIKPYINITDDKVDLVNIGKAMTTVGNMVVDAVTDVGVRRDVLKGETSSLDITSFNEYQYSYNNIRNNIANGVFNRVMSGMVAAKSTESVTFTTT